MLTFIRIRLPNLIAANAKVDRMRAMSMHKPAQPEAEPVHNPWAGELQRLRRGLRSETDQVRFGVVPSTKPVEPAPPPPPPLPTSANLANQPTPQHTKQGTLTDLKIWWGKATIYKTPDPRELARFAPSASKKKNRWMQF